VAAGKLVDVHRRAALVDPAAAPAIVGMDRDALLSLNVSITPQARSRSRSCRASPAKVYNHSKRMKEKRAVLDGVAAELRQIIAEPAPLRQPGTGLGLVA